MTEQEQITIEPQEGPQEMFLTTPADIAFYGGSAGGGKTFALIFEPIRHIDNPLFKAVIFRRTTKQIRESGGLWDESVSLYPFLAAEPKETSLRWQFPSGARVSFSHMEYEKNKFDWQGTQIPLIMFDEVTHFTYTMFFYMLSRNRSTSGVSGYIRCTCNPDPDSWVAEFLSWWIDQETGFPIEDRAGVLRWFIRVNDEVIWADTKEELEEEYGTEEEPVFPKSVTFIPSSIYDNKILMKKDPAYLASLKALPRVEQARLLGGNWKIRAARGDYFKREFFEVVEPEDVPTKRRMIRYWDRAATEEKEGEDPDWTAGCLMSVDDKGTYYIEHMARTRARPAGVEKLLLNTASQDGKKVTIGIEQDPGQAGVFEKDYYVGKLAGYDIHVSKVSKDKVTRAKPLSSQSEHSNNVKVVRGSWNKAFFDELEAFPNGAKDDQVDAVSGAFNYFTSAPKVGKLKERSDKSKKSLFPSHKGARQW